MAVTVTNLIAGPGTLYSGTAFTVTYTQTPEPGDTAVNTTPPATAWTDVGGTSDGVNLEVGREYMELEVDQIVDVPERRLTKRELSLATNLAEATLENLALSSNETAAATVASASNYKTYNPTFSTSATQPTYVPLIFDGYGPSQFRRRVIARKMLSVEPVGIAYKKDAQSMWSVRWAAHYVSSTLPPFKIVDQTS